MPNGKSSRNQSTFIREGNSWTKEKENPGWDKGIPVFSCWSI